MKAVHWLCLAWLAAAVGCLLPDYEKVGLGKGGNTKSTDAGVDSGASTGAVLAGASSACLSCVMDQCAEPLAACGAECNKIKFPLAPTSPAPPTIDPFVACLQDQCDDACDVSWGCVDRYRWPAASRAYSVTLRVIDIVSSQPLNAVEVTACQNSDPSCSENSGLVGAGVTDSTAHAVFGVPQDFVGYFLLKGGEGYMPAVATWTQPTYVLTEGFTQRMLQWDVAAGLATGTDSTLRREASHLIFRAQNCLPLRYLGGTAPHAEADEVAVTFTPPAKDSSRVFYTGFGSTIDRTLDGTSVAGGSFGGAFNLPSQTVTVIGTHAGEEVSRVAIQMRPGTVGFVYLVPNAR